MLPESEDLRIFFRGAHSRVEPLTTNEDYKSRLADMGGGGGGGQRMGPPFGGGGGMDPWQSSVESRLTDFGGRLGKIDERLNRVEVGLATLAERVAHLPSKGFIISVISGGTALLFFADKIKAITGLG